MKLQISNRFTNKVIVQSKTLLTILELVEQNKANLHGANLVNADLHGANLVRANLDEADLHGADLVNVHLDEANLYRVSLSEANLSGADLSRADLSRANLRGANLRGADLSRADLSRANLRGANLRGADLHGANLRGADLHGANLRGADLRGADLSGANLRGADLRGANLSDVNLSGAKGLLDQVNFIKDNFIRTKNGFIVYKSIGNTHYQLPSHWNIRKGSFLEETVNRNPTNECGCGVNFGTKEFCLKNFPKSTLWKCLIHWEDLTGVVVPYNTDGKARCSRLQLLQLVA